MLAALVSGTSSLFEPSSASASDAIFSISSISNVLFSIRENIADNIWFSVALAVVWLIMFLLAR